jgi:hypothetical protein
MDRRTFLPASLAGALAAAAVPRKLFAVEMSDAEKANVKLIMDMVEAFDSAADSVAQATDALRTFFADDCAFRFRPTDLTATRSFGAVEETIKRVTANGQKVQQELLERFAKGTSGRDREAESLRHARKNTHLACDCRFPRERRKDRRVDRILHHRGVARHGRAAAPGPDRSSTYFVISPCCKLNRESVNPLGHQVSLEKPYALSDNQKKR